MTKKGIVRKKARTVWIRYQTVAQRYKEREMTDKETVKVSSVQWTSF